MNSSSTLRWQWRVLFVSALLLWSLPLFRPLDLPSWHEFDYSSIARNYFREGAGVLLPRIDWRRNGPGFTEMEFPFIPWLMSRSYSFVGVQIVIGRLLSLFAALGTLAVFSRLALLLLPTEEAALVATGFLVVNRLLGFVSTALQPESLMLLLYVAAAYAFLQWQNTNHRSYYWVAIGCTPGHPVSRSFTTQVRPSRLTGSISVAVCCACSGRASSLVYSRSFLVDHLRQLDGAIQ